LYTIIILTYGTVLVFSSYSSLLKVKSHSLNPIGNDTEHQHPAMLRVRLSTTEDII